MIKAEIWEINNGYLAETSTGLETITKFFKTWEQAMAYAKKFFLETVGT